MNSMEITAVGIDVSKSKSTVAIRRPGGVIVARPFDISHSILPCGKSRNKKIQYM